MVEETRRIEDELLGMIKKLENKINTKIEFITTEINSKFEEVNNKINITNIKFDRFIETNEENKLKIEKIDNLISSYNKTRDMLLSQELKINTMSKDLDNSKFKYDKLITDNLTVPGFIGDYCKYHTLRDYLVNNIKEMSILNKYKEKTELDFKGYKNKLESLITQFNTSLTQYSNQQIQYVNEAKEDIKNKLSLELNVIDEKIQEVRLENTKVGHEWEEKSNEIKIDIQNILKLKSELNQNYKDEINNIENKFNGFVEKFNSFNNEYLKIKSRFIELTEFIKDVRFRKNLIDFDGIKKKEIDNLVHKIDFKKKKNEEINLDKPLDLDYNYFTGKKEDYELHEKQLIDEAKQIIEKEKEENENEKEKENENIINVNKNVTPIDNKINVINSNNNNENFINNNNNNETLINNNNNDKLINNNNEKLINADNVLINQNNNKDIKVFSERKKEVKNKIKIDEKIVEMLKNKEIKKEIKEEKKKEESKDDKNKKEISEEGNLEHLLTIENVNSTQMSKKNQLKKLVLISSSSSGFKKNDLKYSNSLLNSPLFNKKRNFHKRIHSTYDISNKEAKIVSLPYPGVSDNSLGTSYKKNFNETYYENFGIEENKNSIYIKDKNKEYNFNNSNIKSQNNFFPHILIKDKNKEKNLSPLSNSIIKRIKIFDEIN